MKTILLFTLFILIFSGSIEAQVVANTPDDIQTCSPGYVNLTSQTAAILGQQSAAQYSVSYYATASNAQAGINPIINAANFYVNADRTIFVRVKNNSTNEFAITSFLINIHFDNFIFSDIVACQEVSVSNIQTGNYD